MQMEAIQRYELIRPILRGEKSVKQVHQETKVPIPTLYRYVKRFLDGGEQIESLADKSHAPLSHPFWFTDEQKNEVIQYKLQHPERSARQISRDLAANGRLQISPRSVSNILKDFKCSPLPPENQADECSQVGEVLCPAVSVVDDPISSERVDDIPLLFSIQQKMGIAEAIDEIIIPHGNRCGLSFGWLTVTWLSYILSEADHRMCCVQDWAANHLVTLEKLLSQSVCQTDFTDDRLADILRQFSDDLSWEPIEKALGKRLIRVYNLKSEAVRLDSTSVSVHHQIDETELFRFGHSKDHRPDLQQFKIMLATLDPLGLPLTTLIIAGNDADDGLYLPAINQAKEIVGCGQRLYIGDSKMSTNGNRAEIDSQGDYYLTPLQMTGEVPQLKQTLLHQFVAGEHDYEIIRETKILAQEMVVEKILALGFETTRTISTNVSGDKRVWQERVLAVFSPASARTTRQAFSKRLNQDEAKLLALTPPRGHGQRQWNDIDELKEAAQKIIQQEKVDQFLTVDYQLDRQRRYIRAYKERQPRYEEQSRYVISVERNQKAIKNERQSMGWRLYATNAPVEKLPLAKAVKIYRGSPAIERDFARLKGKSLGIRPLYVQREEHVKGMVRLLSLALRILTTTEYLVRLRVNRTSKPIEGLYPGNPKRQTTRPTTERLLQAFKGITLTIWEEGDTTKQHITPLTVLQARILRFMGLTKEIYMQLIEPT